MRDNCRALTQISTPDADADARAVDADAASGRVIVTAIATV
ncbi:MAG: hypothetical protein ACI83P_001554, partial [Janthinobacterium sp.]